MKKLVWAAVVAAGSAVATRLAVRALERLWRRVTKENPPPPPRYLGFLLGRSTKAALPF